MGFIFLSLRQPQDAVYALERAVEIEPNNQKFLSALAAAYNQAGKKNEAKAIEKRLGGQGSSATDDHKESKKKKKG
jgi:cytochrome c-type biogenesis protein CcmH/NrfG